MSILLLLSPLLNSDWGEGFWLDVLFLPPSEPVRQWEWSFWSQSTQIHDEKILLNKYNFLYDKVIHVVDQRKPADVTVLDFTKTFDTISHSIILDQMSSLQIEKNVKW